MEAKESDCCASCGWGIELTELTELYPICLRNMWEGIITIRIEVIQKAAMLGTDGLLRKVLAV